MKTKNIESAYRNAASPAAKLAAWQSRPAAFRLRQLHEAMVRKYSPPATLADARREALAAQGPELSDWEEIDFSKRILSCGHNPSPHENFTTGAATLPDGREVCYECADAMQRADLLTSDRFTGYVSSNGFKLTTWTGGVLGNVFFGKRHPWSEDRHYVTARDVHGQYWHGTGAPGMWCNLRKCKTPTL